jgi:hypothetical protein
MDLLLYYNPRLADTNSFSRDRLGEIYEAIATSHSDFASTLRSNYGNFIYLPFVLRIALCPPELALSTQLVILLYCVIIFISLQVAIYLNIVIKLRHNKCRAEYI